MNPISKGVPNWKWPQEHIFPEVEEEIILRAHVVGVLDGGVSLY
jgi:hypothetical protein